MFAGERIYRNLDIAYILPRLKQLGVTITNQHFVEEIGVQEVMVYDIWAGPEQCEVRSVDSVVLSILREPIDSLYHAFTRKRPSRSSCGRCCSPS